MDQRLGRSAYVNGRWEKSGASETIAVVNPATEVVLANATAGCGEDVDKAVTAARSAFDRWSQVPLEERVELLRRVSAGIASHAEELASTITSEMGSPIGFSRRAQIGLPLGDIKATLEAAAELNDRVLGRSIVQNDPIGVVGAITPWNFPLHQIVAKVAPALVAGCTVVLKPSEVTPLDAVLLAEIFHEAGAPAGVFNLVLGGRETGQALASHPGIDMISFTGSTRGGREVAKMAAMGLKKVALELGGKSANIILDDADLEKAIPASLGQALGNCGQVCAALSRLIVPEHKRQKIEELAIEAAKDWKLGDPMDPATRLGPLSSLSQQARVRQAITGAIAEGANLLTGGAEQPRTQPKGAYVAPTILSSVAPAMAIAREETFGPVLSIIGYSDDDEAIRIANDSDYGLSGGVWSGDDDRMLTVARRMRTGQVILNGAPFDLAAPFGGVKLSGIGRENGLYGLEEYFAPKAITHHHAPVIPLEEKKE
ncbi:MAG TPA: aldehyde dehydrogenase family protein [Rhizomicrobium sp.]|nr:aldehyde dehydrogenase family protein [Rhizomicrobium sp.]